MFTADLNIVKADIYKTPVSGQSYYVFVQVQLSDGSFGCGEATYHRAQEQVIETINSVIPFLINHPCEHINGLTSELIDESTDLPERTALYALETSVYEARARSNNLPVYELMKSGASRHIGYYANLNRNMDRTPEGWANIALEAVNAGYKGIKLAPFDGIDWHNTENNRKVIDGVLKILDSIRKRIGNTPLVMIDCHWCFDKSQAKHFINEIEPFGIEWVEALIPEETHMAPDLKSLRDHANNKGIKMSGGEFLSGFDAFLPMLGQSCYDVINPDLRFCGIKDMCRLADLAEKKQILFSPHNPVGPLNEIASAHICATTQAFYLLEKQYCESAIAESLIDDSSCPLVNGERELSTGHGWGLSLTENSRANLVAD